MPAHRTIPAARCHCPMRWTAAASTSTIPAIANFLAQEMSNTSFTTWVSRSLVGHIVFVQIFCLPAFIAFVGLNLSEATVGWMLRLFLMCCFAGLFLAIAVWYTVTLPVIRRLRKTR